MITKGIDTKTFFDLKDKNMLANKEFKEALKEALLQLVRQGVIYPKCSDCDHRLNFVEYFNLFCQRCGDISAFGDSKILYHPIT